MGPKSRSGPVGWGGVGLSQTSPIPRSPDGDKNILYVSKVINIFVKVFFMTRSDVVVNYVQFASIILMPRKMH